MPAHRLRPTRSNGYDLMRACGHVTAARRLLYAVVSEGWKARVPARASDESESPDLVHDPHENAQPVAQRGARGGSSSWANSHGREACVTRDLPAARGAGRRPETRAMCSRGLG